jgi:hypothetical protein
MMEWYWSLFEPETPIFMIYGSFFIGIIVSIGFVFFVFFLIGKTLKFIDTAVSIKHYGRGEIKSLSCVSPRKVVSLNANKDSFCFNDWSVSVEFDEARKNIKISQKIFNGLNLGDYITVEYVLGRVSQNVYITQLVFS